MNNEPKIPIKENNFISDGGINNKIKYQDNRTLTKTKNSIPVNLNGESFYDKTTNLTLIPNNHKSLKPNKSFSNHSDKHKIEIDKKDKLKKLDEEIRKNLKKKSNNESNDNSKTNKNLRINNYLNKDNDDLSKNNSFKFNQSNHSNSSSKNENNKSALEKRKNYNVPLPKQKKAKTEESKIEETNIVEDEEEKNKRISNLIFNEVQNIQRKYQEESQNKINKDTQRKIKVLENNNVNIEEILKKNEEVFEEEENEKRESDDEKDYEKEFYENNKNISKINLTNNKNDNSHTNTNKTYSKYSNIDDDKIKQTRKPRVDTLEYCNIINQYKKDSNDNSKILTTDNINRSQSENINSFRKRNLIPSKNKDKVIIKKVDSKTNMVYDSDDNFIMALKGKRTGRSKKEIQDFMKKKKIKEKNNAIKIEEIEKKKNIRKYYELTKLLEKAEKDFLRKKRNKNGNNLNKIKNDYFVGQRRNRRLSNISNLSDSTIIDKDEFLLNILDSKKIINSGIRYENNDNDNIINKDEYEQISNEEIDKNKKEKLTKINQETKEKINKIQKDLILASGSNDSFKEQIKIARNTVKKSEDLIKEKNLHQYLNPNLNQNQIKYSKNKEELRESLNKSKRSKTTESQYEEEENKDYMINNEVPSIQVPSTIQPSNKNTFNAYSNENKDNNNIYDKDNSIKTIDYQFDDEALEAYGEIFNGLNEFLKSIIRRNCLNHIIEYCDIRYRYKIGFEILINLFKFKFFNEIRMYEHYLIYYYNLRKIVLPYIKRAFENIVFYDYNKKKLTFFNKIIVQIFKSFFLRKLFSYDKKNNNNLIPENSSNKKINKIEQQKKIIEEKQAKQPINEINLEKKLKTAINILQNQIRIYCLEKIFNFSYKNDTSNNKSQDDFSKMEERRRNLSNPYSEYSNSFLSKKNNTYIYESFDDKNNSIMLYPNSEDSDRLHRIYQLIESQQEGKSNISQSDQMDLSNISNQTGKSNKSSKSLNEIIKMKPGIKIGSISSLKQKQNGINDKNESYEIKDLSPIPKKDNLNYIKKYNENNNNNNENNRNILNKRNNNSSGKNLLSEQDISADKEVNVIDWEYTVADKSNEKEKNKTFVDKITLDEMPLKKDLKNDFSNEKKNNKIKEPSNDSNKKEQKENSYSEDFNINISVDDLNEKDENILNAIKNEDKSIDNSKSRNIIEDDIPEEINDNKNENNNKINENNNLLNNNNNNDDNIKNENEKDKLDLLIKEPNSNEQFKSNNKNSIESESSENTIIITNKNDNKNVFSINNSGNNTIELSNSIKLNNHNNSTRNNRYEKKTSENFDNEEKKIENKNDNEIKKEIENKDENEKKEQNIKEKPNEEPLEKSKLTNIQKEKLADDITEEIIKNLLFSEIKDKKTQILSKKIQKLEYPSSSPLLSRSNSLNNNPNQKENESSNNSLYTQSDMSNLNNSIFMRTISDVKKDITLNLYNKKIAPKLLKVIGNEIDKEYNNIIDNLKIPLKVNETQLMNGIMLKDEIILSNPNSIFCNNEIQNKEFINKKILKDFENIDKEIRNEDNITSDEYYDNILNECVIDAANELIEKERKYGKIGEPIKWSVRNREIEYKYNKDTNSKKNFKHKILKNLNKMLNYKMALIAENYDYMDSDQLTNDRDTKFYKSMRKELKEDDEEWKCFDTEETQIKLVLSKVIMDQLLNEVVEILEHVFYSRKEPSKYQSKSIYACEDIPRLFFQNTTENNYSDLNDNMNQ